MWFPCFQCVSTRVILMGKIFKCFLFEFGIAEYLMSVNIVIVSSFTDILRRAPIFQPINLSNKDVCKVHYKWSSFWSRELLHQYLLTWNLCLVRSSRSTFEHFCLIPWYAKMEINIQQKGCNVNWKCNEMPRNCIYSSYRFPTIIYKYIIMILLLW